jgi:hypothetical protein
MGFLQGIINWIFEKYDICIPICAGEHTEHERAIFFHDMLPPLHIRLRRIALFAQHLQIVIRGMPALAPRNDMVTFHVLKGILGVDACLLGHIIIQYKFFDVRFQSVANVFDFP